MKDIWLPKSIIVTPEMERIAHQRAQSIPLLDNSILEGGGRLYGCIGEAAVLHLIGGTQPTNPMEYYHFDIRAPDGRRVEVKTKTCSTEPQIHYEASIADANIEQDCDGYMFVRLYIVTTPPIAWIMGWAPKEEYFAKAVFRPKGWTDKDNKWVVPTDCWNVRYSQLQDWEVE